MSMKTKKTVLTVYALLALAAGVGLAIWRTVLIKNYYDPYNFTFEPGSGGTFRTFEYIVLLIALIALTSVIFAKQTSFRLFSARASTTSVAICAVCGFVFATIAILIILFYDITIEFNSVNFAFSLLRLAAVISMIFVSLYFLLCASTMVIGKETSKSALSLSLPIFALLYLTYLYFDTTLMFHDTNRIMGQVAFISILAFFVSEANITTGHMAFGWHFATSLACIVCVCAYILPMLFLVAFWEIKVTQELLMDFSSIGVLLYAIFSAFNAIRTMEKEEAKAQ